MHLATKARRLSRAVALDLGSSSITWCNLATDEVTVEANFALIDEKKGKIIEIGEAAASAQGHVQGHARLVRPFRNGRLVDIDISERYFRALFSKMGFGRFSKPIVGVAAPPFFTAAEKRVIASTMSKAGASKVVFIDAIVAGAVGAMLDIQGPTGVMIASFGAQTTFSGILSLGEPLTSKWKLVGGDTISGAITDYLRTRYNLIMAEADVEELKISLLDLSSSTFDLSANIVGRNVDTGEEQHEVITSMEVFDAASDAVKLMVDTVISTLTSAPAEISNDLTDAGIVLIGRASLTRGIDDVLSKQSSLSVVRSDIVERALVLGTAQILGQVSTS